METNDLSRRGFIKASVAGALAAPLAGGCRLVEGERPPTASEAAGGAGGGGASPQARLPDETPPTVDTVNGMPYRTLGKTQAKVSILGVGGYHIGVLASPEEAVRLVRMAIDEGVNFLDNAWEYHQGRSEERMGMALQDGYRQKAFLMTKVCGRDADTAARQIDESLRRLKTDVIDLLQFHEINYDNDPDLVFAQNGAIHAVVKAQKAGKVRFIGFTGHKSPHIHLKMLRQDFPWDTLQMPLNVMDAHYRSFAREVLPEAVRRGVAVIAMKTAGSGAILKTGVTAAECLRYAMSLPVATTLSGMDRMEVARENIAAAKAFKPLAPEERSTLLARVKDAAGDGRYERFKSTQDFDSRTHREQHELL